MIQKFFIALGFLAVALLSAVFLRADATAEPVRTTERSTLPVTVATVLPEQVRLEVKAQGSVLPAVESQLLAEVSARVVETSPTLVAGGAFRKGDVLLRLDDQRLRKSLERAKAQLSRADAELKLARFERERAAKLAEQKLTPLAGLQEADRRLRVAQASRRDAVAQVKQAQVDLDRATLRAPFDGRVREETVDVGQFLNRGAKIATLYAEGAAEVRLPIHDRSLALLDLPLDALGEFPDQHQPPVTFSAEFAGRELTWSGRVVRRDAAIDASSRMVHLMARVPEDANDYPMPVGLFVDAIVTGMELPEAIVVPRTAVRNNGTVLVLDAENRVEFRSVDALPLDPERMLIREGLVAGERICISPIATPVEGMFVTPDTPLAG